MIAKSYEYRSDLLSEEDMHPFWTYGGSAKKQKQERRQLAEDLMRFLKDAFGDGAGITEESKRDITSVMPEKQRNDISASTPSIPIDVG